MKIIAYDLGTGGNKASCYDADGTCLGAVFVPYETRYPRAGWHEQCPDDWYQAVVQSTHRLLESRAVDPRDVACLAISGHSLGCVPLDAAGRLLQSWTPIWSDKRPTSQADDFFRRVDPVQWYLRTGNGFPAPHYTVFKVMWLRDEEPDVFRQTRTIIGTKDYVNYRLTGRIRTDYSYASGSGVYDLSGWDYSDELLAAARLPREWFPPIVPATEILGELTAEAAAELGLPRAVRVACGGVDNSCMALGARNIAEGRLYASLGSSAWVAVSSARPLLDPQTKPYVFTHVVPGMFTSAVGMFSAGSSFRWVRDHLCPDMAQPGDGTDPYERMTALAGQSPVGAHRLLFHPNLAGGSSLDPSPNIRGALLGLDLGHNRADVIRAAMEGIAMGLRLVLDALRRLAPLSDEMVAVGGGSRSPLWRQIFADALRIRLVKTNVGQEAGALGAAAVAAVGAGLWSDFRKIDEVHRVEEVIEPIAANAEYYEQVLPIFQQAWNDLSRLGDRLAELPLSGRSG